jgi:hypothetical protein
MSLSDAVLSRADPQPALEHRLAADGERLAAALTDLVRRGEAGDFPDETLRHLMAALVKLHGSKFDDGQRPVLLVAEDQVSATAVLVAASALLKASNLEIFELGMWQSWSGTR